MASQFIDNIEIELETTDETTLFSDDEKVKIKKINLEFEQSNKLSGIYRKVTVFNDHHCYQTIKNKRKGKYRYRVDLSSWTLARIDKGILPGHGFLPR